jgi:methionine-S-sulfoxide reductase
METAIFAAGCFWGVQFYFDQVPGVEETMVGYTGGHTQKPSYEDVCSHTTGHAEALKITFDPEKVSYDTLLKQFFKMHDPTQMNRQGPDVGDSYRTAIFYTSDAQKEIAETAKKTAQINFSEPIVTEITQASEFWPAEDYHQKFAERTGRGMCHIPYEAV